MENIHPTLTFPFKLDFDPVTYHACIMFNEKKNITAAFINTLKKICLDAVNTYRFKANKYLSYTITINTRNLVWGNTDVTNKQYTLYVDAREPTNFMHKFWYIDHLTNTFLCEDEYINHRVINNTYNS